MRGANNLQRTLSVLARRHGITLSAPCRLPLTSPPEHPTLILEGVASVPNTLDCDRTRFAPRCFGQLPATLPLRIEHDPSRPAGIAALSYDARDNLRVRTSPLAGDDATYPGFSIAARVIHYTLHDTDTRHFYATVQAATLTEISLTQHPHLSSALVATRMRPSAEAELFGLMGRKFAYLTQIAELLLKIQKEARPR